ncbi:MAG: DUF2231 domain-containing protein [Caldilineales bacterium]|nr:DUF2231 domain-containing protein [Caldilineales bacterium]
MPPNIHPLIVHFPIALLLTSVALSWAGLIWQGKSLDRAAWYTLLLGLAGALFSVISGFLAAAGVPADSPAMATLTTHRLLGIAVLVIFGLQALCAWRSKGVYSRNKRILHTAIQIVGVALVVAVGLYGGELVYIFGLGVASALP